MRVKRRVITCDDPAVTEVSQEAPHVCVTHCDHAEVERINVLQLELIADQSMAVACGHPVTRCSASWRAFTAGKHMTRPRGAAHVNELRSRIPQAPWQLGALFVLLDELLGGQWAWLGILFALPTRAADIARVIQMVDGLVDAARRQHFVQVEHRSMPADAPLELQLHMAPGCHSLVQSARCEPDCTRHSEDADTATTVA